MVEEDRPLSDKILFFLNSSRIFINKKKFIFELESHPTYPSFASITNAFQKFGIDFSIYESSLEDISESISIFFTFLRNESDQIYPSVIQRANDGFISNSKVISNESLLNSWSGIILLLEENLLKKNKYIQQKVFKVALLILCCGFIFFLFRTAIFDYWFMMLIMIGLFLSISAIGIDLKINNKLTNKICATSLKKDCYSIIGSKRWSLFKTFSFSDLSLTFFATQALVFLIAVAVGQKEFYFSFNLFLLISSVPFIFISLYFQKFIEKKWCSICLGISLVLISKLISIILMENDFNVYNFNFLIINILLFSLFFFIIKKYKELLVENRELLHTQKKVNKILYDNQIFKEVLNSEKQITPFNKHSPFSEKIDKKLTLTLVTDPFCIHCKKLHTELIIILNDFEIKDYKINILFNIDIEDEEQDEKDLYLTMAHLQEIKGNAFFFEGLNEWYKSEDIEYWLNNYGENKIREKELEATLEKQKQWCVLNKINYTPALFINQRKFPEIYKIEHLKYFLNELIYP